MSHEHIHVPTREEILAGTSRPLPRSLYTISLILAAIGAVVFIVGAFMGIDRVWQALLVNWLYFTTISSGIRTVRPPFEPPRIDLKQSWHRKFHHDARNRWLRNLMCELFQEPRRVR